MDGSFSPGIRQGRYGRDRNDYNERVLSGEMPEVSRITYQFGQVPGNIETMPVLRVELLASEKEGKGMSKYFHELLIPRPAPTTAERLCAAILDLEKRVTTLEEEMLKRKVQE